MIEKLYTVKDLAEMLQVTEHSIRRYIREGKLECVRIGNTIRFKQEQLDRFLEGSD